MTFKGLEEIIEAFAFLVDEYGFSGPFAEQLAYEFHHQYTQQGVTLDVWDDNTGVYLTINVDGWRYDAQRLGYDRVLADYQRRHGELDGLAAFLRDHPELMSGDSDFLRALTEETDRARADVRA